MSVKGQTSRPAHLSCQVPQGSVFGSVLFILYTAHFRHASSLIMFIISHMLMTCSYTILTHQLSLILQLTLLRPVLVMSKIGLLRTQI